MMGVNGVSAGSSIDGSSWYKDYCEKEKIDRMMWEDDLVEDIRTFNKNFNDQDSTHIFPAEWGGQRPQEVTECNLSNLSRRFDLVKEQCMSILEIGVHRNGDGSFTGIFLKNKMPTCAYFGIDINDKSYLNDASQHIHTIRNDSSSYTSNVEIMSLYGVKHFDFIFIDGWHSINQVLRDWEYTRLLSPHGVVGFHDVTAHPGPHKFIRALDPKKWDVEICCENDYGIGFAARK